MNALEIAICFVTGSGAKLRRSYDRLSLSLQERYTLSIVLQLRAKLSGKVLRKCSAFSHLTSYRFRAHSSRPNHSRSSRGMTLVEVVIGSAVIAIVFIALLGSFQALLLLVTSSRAHSSAVALANEQIEYMRTLPYDDVGTSGGIPSGTILQNETFVLNGLTFNRRTLIQYVDAPEDGEGSSDVNGIVADYKRAKVEISWSVRGKASTYSLITNIVPRGIETIDGGGTLIVNVFDAAVTPVSGASVRVRNTSTSPTIDVTAYTNSSGVVMFPGAPAAANYQIDVTKSGYSTAGTYSASAGNPNPSPAHVAVVESEVSTMNFAIDELSSIALRTSGPAVTGSFSDTFSDSSKIAALTNTVIVSGAITLSGSAGLYAPSGTAYATATAPSTLAEWEYASFDSVTPSGTSAQYRMYSVDELGNRTLVPDSALAGNSAGFTSSPISLYSLSVATYPRLAIGVTLTGGVDTPTVNSWTISHVESYPAIGNIGVAVSGNKSIGTDGAGQPVPKYSTSVTTNGSGQYTLADLEWDLYSITVSSGSGYDVSEACAPVPLSLSPDTDATVRLTLVPNTAHTLKVLVTNSSGTPIPLASVRLSNGGYDETKTTGACGQAFFSGLTSASDYDLEVSKSGYTTESVSDVDVTNYALRSVTLD